MQINQISVVVPVRYEEGNVAGLIGELDGGDDIELLRSLDS